MEHVDLLPLVVWYEKMTNLQAPPKHERQVKKWTILSSVQTRWYSMSKDPVITTASEESCWVHIESNDYSDRFMKHLSE